MGLRYFGGGKGFALAVVGPVLLHLLIAKITFTPFLPPVVCGRGDTRHWLPDVLRVDRMDDMLCEGQFVSVARIYLC
jgi:hypothetical protein